MAKSVWLVKNSASIATDLVARVVLRVLEKEVGEFIREKARIIAVLVVHQDQHRLCKKP